MRGPKTITYEFDTLKNLQVSNRCSSMVLPVNTNVWQKRGKLPPASFKYLEIPHKLVELNIHNFNFKNFNPAINNPGFLAPIWDSATVA